MELCHCEKGFDASQISFVNVSAVEFYLAWKKAEKCVSFNNWRGVGNKDF